MRTISIYSSMLAFLAAIACGACRSKEAPATAINIEAEPGPSSHQQRATKSAEGKSTKKKGARPLRVSGGEVGEGTETDRDSRNDKAAPTAAPPATAGLATGSGLQLDRPTARVGETLSVARSEPFPSGATVYFRTIEAKPVKRLDGGRKLSFKVPKGASSGAITIKVDGQVYTTDALTIE